MMKTTLKPRSVRPLAQVSAKVAQPHTPPSTLPQTRTTLTTRTTRTTRTIRSRRPDRRRSNAPPTLAMKLPIGTPEDAKLVEAVSKFLAALGLRVAPGEVLAYLARGAGPDRIGSTLAHIMFDPDDDSLHFLCHHCEVKCATTVRPVARVAQVYAVAIVRALDVWFRVKDGVTLMQWLRALLLSKLAPNKQNDIPIYKRLNVLVDVGLRIGIPTYRALKLPNTILSFVGISPKFRFHIIVLNWILETFAMKYVPKFARDAMDLEELQTHLIDHMIEHVRNFTTGTRRTMGAKLLPVEGGHTKDMLDAAAHFQGYWTNRVNNHTVKALRPFLRFNFVDSDVGPLVGYIVKHMLDRGLKIGMSSCSICIMPIMRCNRQRKKPNDADPRGSPNNKRNGKPLGTLGAVRARSTRILLALRDVLRAWGFEPPPSVRDIEAFFEKRRGELSAKVARCLFDARDRSLRALCGVCARYHVPDKIRPEDVHVAATKLMEALNEGFQKTLGTPLDTWLRTRHGALSKLKSTLWTKFAPHVPLDKRHAKNTKKSKKSKTNSKTTKIDGLHAVVGRTLATIARTLRNERLPACACS